MHFFVCLLAILVLVVAEQVKSEPQNFTLSNGDTITCMLLGNQLSLAGMKQHEVQMKPSVHYSASQIEVEEEHEFQTFKEEGYSCAEGTIPLLVSQKREMEPMETSELDPTSASVMTHEFATAHLSGKFSGMQTIMSVWKPYVEKTSERSASQLWVVSNKAGKLNTIEAGWAVNGPDQDYPRLFIFWTADNYGKTGCFNLNCKGFVQVSNKIMIGGAFTKPSAGGSTQNEHTFKVFQDHTTRHWWLRINNIDVGYWPASLFNSLAHGSELFYVGGKVSYEKKAGQRHTKTQMGSGLFPENGPKHAAYHREIQYIDESGKPGPAYDIKYIAKAPGCYHSKPAEIKEWGAAFLYGGPGFNSHCP